ncbi:MAG: hypothetical protein IT338_13840 [Thermomicrobiales bacterium]|nr:hypothetical protein [Thermomicrobiales bacterium]
MSPTDSGGAPPAGQSGNVVRPEIWRPADRHMLLGVSHDSDDPTRHRTFEIRASYDASRDGWVAWTREQNLNEQAGVWSRGVMGEDVFARFSSAAECLGRAVTALVVAVDHEANE